MAKKFNFDEFVEKAEKQVLDTETDIKQKIVIRPELQSFIRPLTQEEFNKLEQNILNEGCRDAILLWKNQNEYVLLDGHNRYTICQKHKINFKVEVKDFANLEEAKDWMINNQLGKRNLTEEEKSYYRGLQYKREKKKLGGFEFVKSVGQNVQATHEKLAEEHKVSAKTIQRDEKFAEALDTLTAGEADLKWKILNKEINLPKNTILQLATQSNKELSKIRKQLKSGEYTTKAESKNKNEESIDVFEQTLNKLTQNIKLAHKNQDNQAWQEAQNEFKALTELFQKSIQTNSKS